jgi:predicted dienelactone hydrolase
MTAIAALLSGGAIAQDYRTALSTLSIADDTRPLEGFIWYPTDATEGAVAAHGNKVWEGIQAIPDAAPAGGRFPLVVLSHGMFGNAMNQSWLADALAQRGYVVAAIDHPGTSTWNRDPDARRQLWERPRDISRVIEALISDPRVDPDRIYMAGHSLGGFTAALLAGARYDAEGMDAFCGANPVELVCGIFAAWQVAQTPEDRAAMMADLSDPRIDAFALFDMGGAQALSRDSLGAIARPALVYGAPVVELGGLDLDVQSRALVAAMDPAVVTYHEPEALAHFDFLGACTADAITILSEEEPDDVFVCIDGQDDRRAEQAVIIDEVAAFFAATN